MKARSVANGNVIDLPDDHPLLAAGIYEPVDAANKKDAPEKQAEQGSTKAEPLTTKDIPPALIKKKGR